MAHFSSALPGSHKTRALIFKTAPYREYDKRVVLLTREDGKVTVVAPAAQKSRRRFSSSLDSLTLISAHYIEKVGMPFLQEMTVLDAFFALKKDIKKIAYGSYFSEIVANVLREKEPNAALFDFLVFFLKALEKTNRQDWLARFFEARLLPQIGYLPMLRQCVKCARDRDSGSEPILFSVSLGGIICGGCASLLSFRDPKDRGISSTTIHFLDRMMTEAKMFPLDEQISAELKRFLPQFLFHHLEKEPKSYSFIEALDKFS